MIWESLGEVVRTNPRGAFRGDQIGGIRTDPGGLSGTAKVIRVQGVHDVSLVDDWGPPRRRFGGGFRYDSPSKART